MQYTLWELIFFFFVYSFLGWCLEVAVLSIRRRKFLNPGILSGPFCPSYGVAIDLILVFLAPLLSNTFFAFSLAQTCASGHLSRI